MKNWLSFLKSKKSSGIFIPNGNKYIELTDEISKRSINEITKYLGYEPIEAHTYFGDFNPKSIVQQVVLEGFTENIIFVIAKDSIKSLAPKEVVKFMRNFKPEEEYDMINIKDVLLEGIEEKNLKLEFLSRVLNFDIDSQNGIYWIQKLGVKLSFIDGVLAGFQLDNELREWARHFQNINPDLVADYARVSKMFWGDDYDMIFDEVNLQFEALANIPEGLNNKFIPLHKNKYGTIDLFMLIVCHYGQRVNLDQFETLNKGRYVKIISLSQNTKIRSMGNFKYEFDESGILINVKRNKS